MNPVAATRRAYPYVVVLQSEFTQGTRDQLVAPMVRRTSLSAIAGRLTPIVAVENSEHVVLVPAMAGVRRRDLGEYVGSLAAARPDLLAAIDYLFFGV